MQYDATGMYEKEIESVDLGQAADSEGTRLRDGRVLIRSGWVGCLFKQSAQLCVRVCVCVCVCVLVLST